MTDERKAEILEICHSFADGLDVGPIAGSGWLIVDPLSGYLNYCGIVNTLQQLSETESRPLILIMTFEDGTKLIPAGSDIPLPSAKDWMWI